ncbi:LTA synthase family protein [Leptospira fluminis]|uniref:LTA synthase family protein n=1 Tax=Leptospira fluminis TaxID=2484979 RepID=A0A4R9GRX7_9LEPT|nr:LTA synthase family protein [Leptospira fluminis]TGK19304.1 LTA synthase family protein [Leptospira fluminis]
MEKKTSFNIRLILFYFLLFYIILLLYKIAFVWIYSYRLDGVGVKAFLLASAVGLRFDLATISMLLALFAVPLMVPVLGRIRFYRLFWGYSAILITLWMIGHLSADLIYYENGNKHLGYEGFVFFGNGFWVIFKSALTESPRFLTFMICSAVVFLLIAGFVFWRRVPKNSEQGNWIYESLRLFFIVAFLVIAIRGGIQETPLRPAYAATSTNPFLNDLPLNGIYTSIIDLKSQNLNPNLVMKKADAVRIVRKEIEYQNAGFVSDKYPLLRFQKGTNEGTPPNIVIVMLESWTGKFIRPISDGIVEGRELTPYFNRLVREGRFFTHFFASGGRTTNGMMSVLTGIPDRPGLTVVRTHQVLGNFSGIGSIFKNLGYETYFVTGGDLTFDNESVLMPHWGFQTVVGEAEIRSLGRFKKGAWGYDDADVLQLLHEKISSSSKPFLGVALTLTTHYPYKTPEKRFDIFDSSIRDYEYLNVYHYSDWAIGQFIEKAKKFPYFKNTVFVFVADHTHHRYLNYYEDRNIPFLIYAPGRIRPGKDDKFASQLDIIPTVLGIVGKPAYFSAMGRDLFSFNRTESAYFAYGTLFGWIEKDLFHLEYADGKGGAEYSVSTPSGPTEFCKKDPAFCRQASDKARAFLNLSYQLLNSNSIFPSEKEMKSGSFAD